MGDCKDEIRTNKKTCAFLIALKFTAIIYYADAIERIFGNLIWCKILMLIAKVNVLFIIRFVNHPNILSKQIG